MQQKNLITKGQKFVDEDGEVWVYLETVTYFGEANYVNVSFVFVSDDFSKPKYIGYYEVDDILKEYNEH